MHMQGEPRTMQQAPHYDDVVSEVRAFLEERVAAVEARGIQRERIVIDPGFGFGKTVEHNFELLRNLQRFTELGPPVLVGCRASRRWVRSPGRPAGERLLPASPRPCSASCTGLRSCGFMMSRQPRDALAVLALERAKPA